MIDDLIDNEALRIAAQAYVSQVWHEECGADPAADGGATADAVREIHGNDPELLRAVAHLLLERIEETCPWGDDIDQILERALMVAAGWRYVAEDQL